jgi:hypothetical protein
MSQTMDNLETIGNVVTELRRSLIGEASAALWRTVIKVAKVAPVLALLVGAYPTTGSALGTPEERAACTPDAFRLCSSEIPNANRVIACLKVKNTQLSTACRSVMQRNGSL